MSGGGARVPVAGWAAYLACSWTWCIGMFLPGLLMRDFGWAGYAVFAAPNVVGAALLGVLAPRGARMEALLERHRGALRWFSRVTIAFHLYFAGMIAGPLLPAAPLTLMAGAIAVATLLVPLRVEPGSAPRLAVMVWLVSAALACVFVATGPRPDHTALVSGGDAAGGAWMLPVCVLGFGLCPYLDLTFLRAHQASGSRSPAVFALGFCVLFAAMIGFTAWYAPALPMAFGQAVEGPARLALAAHLVVQSAFTIAAHTERMIATARGGTLARGSAARLGMAAAVAMGLGGLTPALPSLWAMPAGEVGYRVFMAFYGLVFPAYVWLVAMPRGVRTDRAVDGRGLAIRYGVVVVAAAPCYAAGFLGGPAWWAAIGAAVVIGGRALPMGRPTGDRGDRARGGRSI